MTPAELAGAVLTAARGAFDAHGLDTSVLPGATSIERPRNPEHGDYASNLAMQLAKRVGTNPRQLAGWLAEGLRAAPGVHDVDIAGPGFLNIRLDAAAGGELARTIVTAGEAYGRGEALAGRPVRLSEPPDLVDAIGADAARYALARHPAGPPVELDLDAWARHSQDNPFHRVRYAHARTASLLRNAAELGISRGAGPDPALLSHHRENDLLKALGEFPGVVSAAAGLREPHRVTRYLEELAGTYHRFSDACRVLPMGDEPATPLTRARLWLVAATRTVLANGLALLGVSAPERM